jgi:hypothetical protein
MVDANSVPVPAIGCYRGIRIGDAHLLAPASLPAFHLGIVLQVPVHWSYRPPRHVALQGSPRSHWRVNEAST